MSLTRIRFVLSLFVIESVIIILFVEFVGYDTNRDRTYGNAENLTDLDYLENSYKNLNLMDSESMYQDIHTMIFLGLGFLYTSLRNYGYSALGVTMILGAIGIQWAILCRGIFHHNENWMVQLNINTLINADFATASVLISVGAVLGVATYSELIIICLVEIFLYSLNEFVILKLLKIKDLGGSLYIHVFATYYGLALSRILRSNKNIPKVKEKSSKNSDTFAMLGTLILWVYWPSFNGILASAQNHQQMAILNTLLALCGSVVFTFIVSILVSDEYKLSIMHIQNATLAGGAAIGGVADLMVKPFGAIMIGCTAGVVSTLGFAYLTPFLQSKFDLHDTAGIHNLHGMTGIIGAISGAVMACIASEAEYGKALYEHYPARIPLEHSIEFSNLMTDIPEIKPGENRSALTQAFYQLVAIGVSIVISVLGGIFTGLVLNIPVFGKIPKTMYFDDSYFWHIPQDEEQPELLTPESLDSDESSESNLQKSLSFIMESNKELTQSTIEL